MTQAQARILLLVDGAAASLPGMQLLLRLQEAGFSVQVTATEAALAFQPAVSWSAFSGLPCLPLDQLGDEQLKSAELLLAAPISLNLLEELLGSQQWRNALQSNNLPLLAAPAMSPEEAEQSPQFTGQFAALPPGSGLVLPGEQRWDLGALGSIALPSVETCLEEVCNFFTVPDLLGKKLLLTAGATIEDIDPVRFISNRSTGRMGLALARAAARRGASVSLVHGPVADPLPANSRIKPIAVRSAQQMYECSMAELSQVDIAILCAAVADFSPDEYVPQKIKKRGAQELSLLLRRTPDILASMGKLENRPFLVGFAAESDDLELNARLKLQSKQCDMICANDIREPGSGFAVSTNRVSIYSKEGHLTQLPLLSKDKCAEQIIEQVSAHYYAWLKT
ncbi:MAG: bifunctional phosphopantothenoylcysteine decarboxylase/phosphopantothenate--cysteine ligase CoaBC [Lentisphaeria bacterium]|nr:bifunctional phosphopantothenoylcysteine decarboxylase/phosphopantothenate--cysteine ligase CoaBC [Lentisphaeria bacterium]